MRLSVSTWALLAACGAIPACNQEESSPPHRAVSCDRRCVFGGRGNPGADGGSGGSPSDASGSFQGEVTYFFDTSFTTTVSYTGPGTITIYGAPATTGSFQDGAYALTAPGTGDLAWALVRPTRVDGGTAAIRVLPTLQLLDSRATTMPVELVPENTLSEVYAQLGIPSTVDATRAQILLRFVTASGGRVSGVSVTPPAGAVVAYDSGAGYSDFQTATGAGGTAILVNASALPLPGSDVPIAYSVSGRAGTASIRAAQGSVSLLLVTVSP